MSKGYWGKGQRPHKCYLCKRGACPPGTRMCAKCEATLLKKEAEGRKAKENRRPGRTTEHREETDE